MIRINTDQISEAKRMIRIRLDQISKAKRMITSQPRSDLAPCYLRSV